jgi:hypothetical protein
MAVPSLIATFPLLVVGIAAAVSLRAFSRQYPVSLKKLSVLWVINFCVDLAGHITRYYDLKNYWLYNIYFWIMYLAVAHLYEGQIDNAAIRKSIRWFYILFPLLVLGESIVAGGIIELQSVAIVCGDVFMIFLVAAYFRQLYLSEDTEPITRNPWFWFSFGFLIHFGGTVPFLGMMKYLWDHYKAFTKFYYLYFSNSFTIFLNLLIIIGFLCRKYYQKLR